MPLLIDAVTQLHDILCSLRINSRYSYFFIYIDIYIKHIYEIRIFQFEQFSCLSDIQATSFTSETQMQLVHNLEGIVLSFCKCFFVYSVSHSVPCFYCAVLHLLYQAPLVDLSFKYIYIIILRSHRIGRENKLRLCSLYQQFTCSASMILYVTVR